MRSYTANDNRSMQMNPNNERYYSSRGYSEDDDDDYEDDYEFVRSSWKMTKDRAAPLIKNWVDDNCISLFGKKVLFKRPEDMYMSVLSDWDIFFRDVSREGDNLEVFKDLSKEEKGLTVSYSSFKEFFKGSEHVKDILEAADRFDMKYLYFEDVYVSNSYMFFRFDMMSQGSYVSHFDYTRRWHFASNSYDSLADSSPEVLYENFEDVFTCKKYLVDL